MVISALTFGQRVWRGDTSTVLEARRRAFGGVEGILENELLPYASTLYSFKHDASCADELLWLRPRLMESAETISNPHFDRSYGSHWADRVDMLTTYFAWFAEQERVSADERVKFRAKAHRFCVQARQRFEHATVPASHSRYLIMLTEASLSITSHSSVRLLQRVAQEAQEQVANPNQRARIYRKLGLLYPQVREWHHPFGWVLGVWWALRACLVQGCSWNVRLKSLSALVGAQP